MNPQKRKLYAILVLFLIGAFTAFFISRLPNLKFDYDFEAFFPNENEELKVYNEYRKTFEYDNEFVLIGIENRAGIFRKDFLSKVDRLTEQLRNTNKVSRVLSPTRLENISFGAGFPERQKVLHTEEESRYAEDSIKIYSDKKLVSSYFPPDAKSICLFVKTKEGLSKKASDQLANDIENLIISFRFDDVHYVGRIFAQKIYLDYLQREFILFIGCSLVLLLLFLWFSFRSLYGTLVPLTVVIVSMIWTLGCMELLGKPVDIMCTMLPTMVLVSGMSDVVHYFSKYFEERHLGTPSESIFKRIGKEVAYPTFLTLITTIIGFLSLLFSSMRPIRDFGIYTSFGLILAFLLTYSLLPALIYLFPPSKIDLHNNQPQREFIPMRKGMHFVLRNQKKILALFLLLTALSLYGMSRIRINNILLEDLSDKIKIKQDFDFFDQHYSGARPFELKVEVLEKESNIWKYELLKEIQLVDSFISKEYQAGFLLSPVSVAEQLNAQTGNSGAVFPNASDYEEISSLLNKNRKNKDLLRIVSYDGRTFRISGKIKDMGSQKVNAINSKLFAFINSKGLDRHFKFELTGAGHLIDRNNAYMVENMLQGFAFSILLISILTYLIHRSWRIVLVFLLPNLIPLILVSGLMGFMGIELKAATSLVFSIAFGIATDDTIHFISRLKIELNAGKSYLYAFKRTYLETGKPIVLTTFILIGGFIALMLSDFQSIYYFGFLICITMLVAVLADLLLLPVLLFLIYPGSRSKTKARL